MNVLKVSRAIPKHCNDIHILQVRRLSQRDREFSYVLEDCQLSTSAVHDRISDDAGKFIYKNVSFM
jgi:hypothetical protein